MQAMAFVGQKFLFPAVYLVALIDLEFWPMMILLCILHAGIGFCWANLSVAGNTIVSYLLQDSAPSPWRLQCDHGHRDDRRFIDRRFRRAFIGV
jgi:hypothetical protein